MPPKVDPRAVFCARLKQAREAAGLSQKELGILAGLDRFVASTRINRYEKGIHKADVQTAERLARVLTVPLAYLYSGDERLARAIIAFSRLSREKQDALLREMEEMLRS
ncbi:XRE family transcriptional regulator [Rhodanobacter glycinis]|uniref:helix-turn-helix domain-containing protein n=1 Tax=Rhodanobacter glycinis TaxID=582702 RepID=UPI00112EE10F|nr:helix-turn-helix transcriptional regulator [Rhodanobacter glycinis]TPG50761.1 XRE family transcriptional regulator [Rhodanobacter glycinis]